LNLPENSSAVQPKLMEDLLASLPEAVVAVQDGRVLFSNAAFTRMFGYTAEEVSDASLCELIVPEARRSECAQIDKAIAQAGFASIETVRKNKAGETLEVALEARPLFVEGAQTGQIFTFRDISERKRHEAKLQHDALHDALTGLPNRALFLDRLSQAFSHRARHRSQNCGVLFLDLDRFKEINDTLGHGAGDELLRLVAERLRSALRPQDTAARLGGDEFAILVESILSIADIQIVASRVLEKLDQPYELCGRSIRAGASIGVAMAGPDHTAPELLIRDADFAMYRAKQDGGGRFEIFDKQLEMHVASQQERERELREVLDKRLFEIWYQPIFRLAAESSRKLEGFEALLYWRRADGSVTSFAELMPVAEETGLSISLGRETIEAVCKQLRTWTGAPQSELTLAVNLTQQQFYHADLIPQLKRTLAATGVDPARLLFEIGEATLSENPVAALGVLERLLNCNVRLAVDDFGSGLAPLNHLVRMPIDVLKLAPELTQAAAAGDRQSAVLESLIHLGSALGVQVIAQGIESTAQVEALMRMGCEFGEGSLLSPPLDLAAARKLAGQGL